MAYKRKRYKLENVEAFRVARCCSRVQHRCQYDPHCIKNERVRGQQIGGKPRSPVLISRAALEKWLERWSIKKSAALA